MAIYINCRDYDSSGNYGGGWIRVSPSISGQMVGIGIVAEAIELSPSLTGTLIISTPWTGSAISLASKLALEGELTIGSAVLAKIKWSNIGAFDFTQGRSNVAGDMYLRWKGSVWKVLQLGTNVIVYGSGGVTKLTPSDNAYGQKTLSKIGLLSEWSIDGSEDRHFFVDAKGRFCTLKDEVRILGYEEFLSLMTNPVVLYDALNELVFITDDTLGYVYSIFEESMGTCPPNLTAVTHSEEEVFVAASGAVAIPAFEISSDILDFTTRGDKTIHEIEVGTNLTGTMEASVDFSLGINSAFVSMGWHPVSPHGVAYVPCFGKEFKFKIRATTALELDYVRVKGRIHDYNPIDT